MPTGLITFASLVGPLPRGHRPDRALWTEEEVLNWIAFQIAAPHDLTGYLAIMNKWGSEPSPDGTSHEMLSAFVALAEGRRLWDPATASKVHENAPEWMTPQKPPLIEMREERALLTVRHRKVSAGELAIELAEEMRGYSERRAQYLIAKHALVEAEQRGEIGWRRAPDAGAYAGREASLHWYLDKDVLKLWPERGATDKSPIPKGRLLAEWAGFVDRHVKAGTRPNVADCMQAMSDAFPNHQPPTVRRIGALRAAPPTPATWTQKGRHKNRN